MKLKKYKKRSFGHYVSLEFIIIITSFIMSILVINYFANQCEDILLPLAKSKLEKVISLIINNASNGIVIDDDLYSLDKNGNQIRMINYDTNKVNKLIDMITYNVEKQLDNSSDNNLVNYFNDGVYGEISSGMLLKNPFLTNIGPKIKLKFEFMGNVLANLETLVKPYGINNAYIEVSVEVTVNGRIILPFVSENVTISNSFPLSINIVTGNVPESYISTYK